MDGEQLIGSDVDALDALQQGTLPKILHICPHLLRKNSQGTQTFYFCVYSRLYQSSKTICTHTYFLNVASHHLFLSLSYSVQVVVCFLRGI